MKIWLVFLVFLFPLPHTVLFLLVCQQCQQILSFMCLDSCLVSPTRAAHPTKSARVNSALLWSSMKLGPSSETSATSGAWPWRNMPNSKRGTAFHGSHWSTFDTVTDGASQPITALETDRHSFYRWDEVGWVWLIGRLSLSQWGITKLSLHSRRDIFCLWMSVSTHGDAFAPACTWGMCLQMWVVSLTQITYCS